MRDDSASAPGPAFAGHSAKSPIIERLARVICGVVRQALEATGAEAVVLMDAESAEGAFLTRIFSYTGVKQAEYADADITLTVHPANKTALLLGGFIPRVDLLPLGDLYASQVEALIGEWTGDDEVMRLAALAGGIEALDRALMSHIEDRALLSEMDGTPPDVCDGIAAGLARTRFRRGRTGLVPKLGRRTIGVDLLD